MAARARPIYRIYARARNELRWFAHYTYNAHTHTRGRHIHRTRENLFTFVFFFTSPHEERVAAAAPRLDIDFDRSINQKDIPGDGRRRRRRSGSSISLFFARARELTRSVRVDYTSRRCDASDGFLRVPRDLYESANVLAWVAKTRLACGVYIKIRLISSSLCWYVYVYVYIVSTERNQFG